MELGEVSLNRGGITRLIVGTAQLGMIYGVANQTYLNHDQKLSLLQRARAAGITSFDTARAYGRSENVLGDFIRSGEADGCDVVTKLAPLAELPDDALASHVEDAVRASVRQSQLALGMPTLSTLLLHRAQHLDAWDGRTWETLLRLRDDGQIGVLGVSVQTPDEVLRALEDENVGYVQMPFNLLDHRWASAIAALESRRERRPVKVAVRSIYLQGLLLSDDDAMWERAHVDDSVGARRWMRNTAVNLGLSGIDDLCLAYAAAQTWIDGIVIGIDNEEQLMRNLDLMSQPGLSTSKIAALSAERPAFGADTLDPSKWMRGPL
ncbi:aldo/keto reductase [Shinella sumterensis]|uniref:Aldo/keto reductase n=1 Tax=Shinella sumterensis TaxID=1967501 RepID=A0AA50CI27_9HYPH|nr:aldo/keto reductase [Shinella sumterensis]WLR96188.1 aldo/keto reductase [Shinella sumterensis]